MAPSGDECGIPRLGPRLRFVEVAIFLGNQAHSSDKAALRVPPDSRARCRQSRLSKKTRAGGIASREFVGSHATRRDIERRWGFAGALARESRRRRAAAIGQLAC